MIFRGLSKKYLGQVSLTRLAKQAKSNFASKTKLVLSAQGVSKSGLRVWSECEQHKQIQPTLRLSRCDHFLIHATYLLQPTMDTLHLVWLIMYFLHTIFSDSWYLLMSSMSSKKQAELLCNLQFKDMVFSALCACHHRAALARKPFGIEGVVPERSSIRCHSPFNRLEVHCVSWACQVHLTHPGRH